MNKRALKTSVAREAIRNAAVVKQITNRGGDLNRDQIIDCFFFAPTEDDAISLARALQSIGVREISIRLSDETSDVPWSVHGEISSSVTAFTAAEQSEKILRLAAAHHCVYDGWGTLLDQGPGTHD